ncbi:MAG: bifunctional diaminohydroxyphosphoribosylaminopyrimidine deaminase/5-amino-6-(5-phosphoribosylamino)uracil reductase RibD [Melioribacteraceae bacterium]|nr:bifunctional diaminohydroxyphosphoribosylaminopyrimidine deaminase/5-amino-6-(5-phosphoribosylamino)uracil reductase RibD [Melioribacteraceae bacterium]
MENNNLHEKYIKTCFDLAQKGKGAVSPNPLVGAVIVKNNKIISTGYHRKPGENHAEREAILQSKVDLKDADLYCNLEPCNHSNKRTPPCVPLIIESGISRVFVSNLDPNPEVNGKGIKELRAAGVEVTTGVLEKEGSKLNKFFFKHIKTKLPYITVKIALTLDGFIAEEFNKQTWITSESAKKHVHKLRSEYDAVLIGANTVNIDNPELTVRLTEGRNPLRVILDADLISGTNQKIFDTTIAETWLFSSANSDEAKKELLKKKNIKIFELKRNEQNLLDLKEVLKILGDNNINSVLIEGGGEIFTQFVDNSLFDELLFLKAPKIFGKGIPALNLTEPLALDLENVEIFEQDIGITYLKKS